MKQISTFILLICCVLSVKSQQIERQVLLSLQDGENIIYGENCFSLSADKSVFTLLTRQESKYFIYENGQRKGPYSELNSDMLPACPDMTNKLCGTFDPDYCGGTDQRGKFVSYDQNYAMVINFHGKTFGPYMGVLQFMTTCDEQKFAAVVMTGENKILAVHSNGKSMEIEGTVSWMKLSADGNQAIFAYLKTLDPSKIDVNNINVEDFTKLTIVDLNGTKYGPFDSNEIRDSDFWFCKSGGSHWYVRQGEVIMRDGKTWKTFSSAPSTCDFWVNENGTAIGINDYGDALNKEVSGVFHMMNALDISVFIKNGKQWIKWISLENQKDLVVYQRPL